MSIFHRLRYLLVALLIPSAQLYAQNEHAPVANAASATVSAAVLPSVASVLEKMATTSHQITYEGTFTYQNKDFPALQGFRVYHWIEDGVEHERLQHLNGPEREITRTGKAIGCASMGDQLLLGKLSSTGTKLARMDQLYRFEVRGPERVAGRNATVLLAIPLDPYRYSYFLSIDNETGLVLKSWLVDDAGRPMERYQFVDLSLNPNISEVRVQPEAHLHRDATADTGDCDQTELSQPVKWQLEWIPPGFAFVGQKVVKEHIDMLMYTDGLTTFSVFIDSATTSVPEGVAQRGATLAVMDKLIINNQPMRVTVVGEVPVVTAQKIAQNIKPL